MSILSESTNAVPPSFTGGVDKTTGTVIGLQLDETAVVLDVNGNPVAPLKVSTGSGSNTYDTHGNLNVNENTLEWGEDPNAVMPGGISGVKLTEARYTTLATLTGQTGGVQVKNGTAQAAYLKRVILGTVPGTITSIVLYDGTSGGGTPFLTLTPSTGTLFPLSVEIEIGLATALWVVVNGSGTCSVQLIGR